MIVYQEKGMDSSGWNGEPNKSWASTESFSIKSLELLQNLTYSNVALNGFLQYLLPLDSNHPTLLVCVDFYDCVWAIACAINLLLYDLMIQLSHSVYQHPYHRKNFFVPLVAAANVNHEQFIISKMRFHLAL